MHRRTLLTAAPGAAVLAGLAGFALSGCAGFSPLERGYAIPLEQLQGALDRRFPRRIPLAGLIELNLQPPLLRLLPAQNRVGVEMAVTAGGPALGGSYSGAFDADFGLRYQPSDATIRARDPHVNALRLDGLASPQGNLLAAFGPALAEQLLQDVVLHQLAANDLALADRMGVQPGAIDVTPQGLLIGFVPRPR